MNNRSGLCDVAAGFFVGVLVAVVTSGVFLVPHWRETHSQELVDQGLLEWRVDRVTGEKYLASPCNDPLEPPPIPKAGE